MSGFDSTFVTQTPNGANRFVLILIASLAVHGLLLLWQADHTESFPVKSSPTLQVRVQVSSPVGDLTGQNPSPAPAPLEQALAVQKAVNPVQDTSNRETEAKPTNATPGKRPTARADKAHTPVTPRELARAPSTNVSQPHRQNAQTSVNTAVDQTAAGITQEGDALSEAERTTRVRHALQQALAFHRYYPPMAIRRGWQGRVQLGLTVQPDGQLTAVRVVQTSGYALLDRAALRSVDQVGPLPEAGRWLIKPLDMIIPVRYQLNDQEA